MNASSAANPVVRSFHHAESGTWTHVLVDPATRRAAIIDAVLEFDVASGLIRTDGAQRILEYIETAGLGVDWILETHAHADHFSAGAWLRARTGAQLGIGAGIVDVQQTFKRVLDLGPDFASDGSQFDRLFAEGDTFAVGNLEVCVIATPGHTADSISYRAGDTLFVGDTLFAPHGGSARCDFPGGDANALYRSIDRLYALPDETRIFLCHDYPVAGSSPLAETTVIAQKNDNLHVRGTTAQTEFVALRTQRDATLATPKLMWPAIQFNLRGGRLPDAAENGRTFLKLPAAFADS